MTETVSVEIFGKTYSIKCPSDKKHELHKCVKHVNEHLMKLNQQRNQRSRDQLVILTALNFAQLSLEEDKNKYSNFSSDYQQLQKITKKIEEKLERSG